MAKISRNVPCPCGSGKKYKKCCLLQDESNTLEERKNIKQNTKMPFYQEDDLDELSNSVVDLVNAGEFNKAESVCHELSKRFPDQVDGIERLALVYESRGENERAAEQYRKAVAFMRSNYGFDKESVQWLLEKIKQLENT
jgi:tetratricopeptide (TPR) repeat protein